MALAAIQASYLFIVPSIAAIPGAAWRVATKARYAVSFAKWPFIVLLLTWLTSGFVAIASV
jgi:hypothetical protein